MKILYVSSNHPSLEYDDLSMLNALGIDWFSTGVYLDPRKPLKSFMTRRPIEKDVDSVLLEIFQKDNPSYVPFENSLVNLTSDLFRHGDFDLVWVTHTLPNIQNNLAAIGDLPIIWRTYNQHPAQWEQEAKPLLPRIKIIRMGETERNRKTLAAPGEVIRAYVDEDVFNEWKGNENSVLTFYNRFSQRLKQSRNSCPSSYCSVRKLIEGKLPFDLYGFPGKTSKEDITLKYLSQEEQLRKYQGSKIYFSLNSESAVYTNSLMEAAMTGMPIVTFGKKTSNPRDPELHDTYEVPYLFSEDEIFITDDIRTMADKISTLFHNEEERREMSEKVKTKARKLFSKQEIFKQWQQILNTI